MKKNRINTPKRRIEVQKYEEYWKLTLALTDFYGPQFRRTLKIIIDHIEYYQLNKISWRDKVKNPKSRKKNFKEEVVHYDELVSKIKSVFPNDDESGASTRKQINTFIKLGFVKPFFDGYAPGARKFANESTSDEDLKRILSDTLYEYASFNSSAVNDDTEFNQVKFVVQTLLHRETKQLTIEEIIGLSLLHSPDKRYATEKEILNNKSWANYIEFSQRKYNQINYIKNVLCELEFFDYRGKGDDFVLYLTQDAHLFLPENKDTERDQYRFSLMKKAVHLESERLYGDEVDWLTKEKQMGMVVSHIYPSAEALSNYDVDSAYDPNNALLLAPGDNDQYFDKHYITFDSKGTVVFGDGVRLDYIKKITENNYKLDSVILNEERKRYLKQHNEKFRKKNSIEVK